MGDNWLIKFASRQAPSEVQFKQQLENLPLDQLRELVGTPSTSHIEDFQEKAASAIAQGRRLAHEAGPQLLEKSAAEAAADQALMEAVNSLSDEDAIKVAQILESGTDVEKTAMLGELAGKALKGIGEFAFKHPHATAAIGGGLAGGLATGNLRGAAVGAGLGYGAARFAPGLSGAIQRGGFGASLKGQQLMPKVAEEIQSLYKAAMIGDCEKAATGADQSWLTQFEGTPLLPAAISVAEEEVQAEIAEIQRRQEREARMKEEMGDDYWIKRDIIRARKHLLELQLVAQRNGLGAQADQAQGVPANAPAAPQAQPPSQPQGVGATQAPLGDQSQNGMPKQAGVIENELMQAGSSYWRREHKNKNKQAGIGSGAAIGSAIGAIGGATLAHPGHRLKGALSGAVGGGVMGGALGYTKGLANTNKAMKEGIEAAKSRLADIGRIGKGPIEKQASFPNRR